MSVLQTRDLRKHYGRIEALRGVTLSVERGEIFGLLGQNGAGKTTLIKVLLGIAWKTDGDAFLLGEPSGTVGVRQRVGYLPEDHRFPEYHSAWSLMNFYGKLMGLRRQQRRRRAAELLELVGLNERMYTKVRTFSKGMKQRLGVAQAILHDPDVIFLDEPTDGVDPVGRREIRAIMQRLRDAGKTLFLNSHLLGEVELICNRVAIMQLGQIIREGTVDALTRMTGLYVVGLAPGETFPAEEVTKHGYAVTPRGELWEIGLADGQTIDPVVRLLHARGLNLRHLVEKRQTLEDQFVEVVTATRLAKRFTMKFLAILEDSFRDAIASYVCMVQIALTVVFVLLVASLSFLPMDATTALHPLGAYLTETIAREPGGLAELSPIALNSRDPFTIQAAQPLDGAATPHSSYRITLAVQCASVEAAQLIRRNPAALETLIRRDFGKLHDRRYLDVTDVQLVTDSARRVPPVAAWFDVTARPTSNLPLLWPYQIKALFGLISLDEAHHSISLGQVMYSIENDVINTGVAWAIVMLSIVVTAYLIPDMLRKGAVDLLLVRPLHRVRLLVYRYLSGVIYVLVSVGLMISALWLVLGLRSGVWKPGLLLSIPVITFFFAILYAVSALNGVVTRSAVTAILVTCIIWFGLWILGMIYTYFDQTRGVPSDADWAYPIVDTLHAILPRTSDLNLLMRKVLAAEMLDEMQGQQLGVGALPAITWAESLTVSAAFIAALLGLASWRFYRKDY